MKTMIQLKLARLEYEHRASGVAKAPNGKVPYIEDDGAVIADSTLIRRHIERKYKVDLDEGLSVEQRAAAWSLEKMAEEHLYFALSTCGGATTATSKWVPRISSIACLSFYVRSSGELVGPGWRKRSICKEPAVLLAPRSRRMPEQTLMPSLCCSAKGSS